VSTHRELAEIAWERHIPGPEAERLYELYHGAFAPMATLSAVRQVLRRDEFLAEMADPRMEKLVARDTAGEAVGITIITADLGAVPWISPEFFAARYPAHAARGAIYYIAFSLAHRDVRGSHAYVAMLDALLLRLTQERAVCVYDICAHNNVTMRYADNLRRRANRYAVAVETVMDTQTFYSGEFVRPRADAPRPHVLTEQALRRAGGGVDTP
jgi:hypothetical protein